jgi:origin recognition complex subunit 3
LKHFTSEPLTTLVHTTPSNQVLSRPESFGFLDSLATRLTIPFSDSAQAMESEDWRSQTTLSTIVTRVNRARESFYGHAQNLRIGFGIMRCIQAFLERQGYKGLQWSADPRKEGGLYEAMVDVLRGKVGGDIKLLGMFIKSNFLLSLSQRSLLIFFSTVVLGS